jgi:hypothetical protein
MLMTIVNVADKKTHAEENDCRDQHFFFQQAAPLLGSSNRASLWLCARRVNRTRLVQLDHGH